MRNNAAGALGSIREKAQKAIPELISLAKNDPYSEVRVSAVDVLGKINPTNTQVLTTLNEALKDRSWRVRRSAADAFAEIGVGSKIAVPNLVEAMNNNNYTLRSSAAKTLGLLGPEAKDAIPYLTKALINNDNTFAQGQAALAIGNIITDDPETINKLINTLDNPDPYVRTQAFESIKKVVNSLTNKIWSEPKVNSSELQRLIKYYEDALLKVNAIKNGFSSTQKDELRPSLGLLKAKQTEKAIINTILYNPLAWSIIIYLGIHLGLFYLQPMWLLEIDKFLKLINLKIPILGFEINLRFLLLFKFHTRVLDAWVAAHIQSVQEEFMKIENVAARKVYIPIPAMLDGHTVSEITSQQLTSLFNRPMLIWGEGGVGKTSLACQIAQWSMSDKPSERPFKHQALPILIEEDLDCEGDKCNQALLDAIAGQLKFLTREEDPISNDLLEQLLRRRRILVIIDHLSEMKEETQKVINPDQPDFPINALIVTSRQKDVLGHINKVTLKPLRIMGNRLSFFLEAYLTKYGKRDLFTDSEFFDACSHLSHMVGQREITAMLATLYGQQLINSKVESAQDISAIVSDNIPDLMLSYLSQLNQELTYNKLSECKFDDRTIHKDAMRLAWACVEEKLSPTAIKRENAISALAELRGEEAEKHLIYLEHRLFLIQTVGVSQDQVRFSLEPLAEYLAALYLIEVYDSSESQWLNFVQIAETKLGKLSKTSGFLDAVRDCCLNKCSESIKKNIILTQLNNCSGPESAVNLLTIANEGKLKI